MQEDRGPARLAGQAGTLLVPGKEWLLLLLPVLPMWLEDGLSSQMDSLQRDLLSLQKPLRPPQSILLHFLLHTPYSVAHFPDGTAVPGRSSVLQLLQEAPVGRVQEAWAGGRRGADKNIGLSDTAGVRGLVSSVLVAWAWGCVRASSVRC